MYRTDVCVESCQPQLWSQSDKCIRYTDDRQINPKFQARLDTFFSLVGQELIQTPGLLHLHIEAPTII